MAETTYHVPFPLPRSETKILGSFEESLPPVDWDRLDRLLILMGLVTVERLLRLAATPGIDIDIKFQVIDRLQTLIEFYKDPYGDR
jgi:hypothetical protein